ncbi:hypothetical protein SAMN05444157_3612 [Frankineae bacterium MT45]|nr:hypothetical protein SAMN05444157_3612 [Frankineae bacterium MT45]
MTSINTSTAALTSSSLLGADSSSRPKGPLDVAANLFGMSKSDLTSELKSGKSLSDIAKEKGISEDDLESALAKNDPSDASDADKLSRAKDIASRVGLPERPQGPHGPPPSDASQSTSSSSNSSSSSSGSSLLDELSSLLKTDPTTLTNQLKSGTSLSDLLSSSGVSLSSLASTLQQGLLYDNSL